MFLKLALLDARLVVFAKLNTGALGFALGDRLQTVPGFYGWPSSECMPVNIDSGFHLAVTNFGIGMRIVRASTRWGTTPGILASYNAVST